jgi:hypothetical protein
MNTYILRCKNGSRNESFYPVSFTADELSVILPDIVETCLESKKGSDLEPLFSFMNMQVPDLLGK